MADHLPPAAGVDSPIPLSFPAILINPRLKHLIHHHQPSSSSSSSHRHHHIKSSDPFNPHHLIRPLGKRRQHRLENAHFTSNPHITKPSTRDFQLWQPDPPIRFTTPPPRGYPSSLYIPPVEPIPIDSFSSKMGAFNRSLKGVRRTIRKSIRDLDPQNLPQHHGSYDHHPPTRLEEILIRIDQSLADWIDTRTVWTSTQLDQSPSIVDPDPWPNSNPIKRNQPSTDHPNQDQYDLQLPSIVEISRSPYTLKWSVPNRFGRFLVHCVARYYGIVSFSPHSNPTRSSFDSTTGVIVHDDDDDDDDDDSAPSSSYPPSSIVCMIKAHLPTRRGSRVNGHQSLDTPPTTDLDSEQSAAEVLSEGSGAMTEEDDDHRSAGDRIEHRLGRQSTLAPSTCSSVPEGEHDDPSQKKKPAIRDDSGTELDAVEGGDHPPVVKTELDRTIQGNGWTPTTQRSIDLLNSNRSPQQQRLTKPVSSSSHASAFPTPRVVSSSSSIYPVHLNRSARRVSFLDWVRS